MSYFSHVDRLGCTAIDAAYYGLFWPSTQGTRNPTGARLSVSRWRAAELSELRALAASEILNVLRGKNGTGRSTGRERRVRAHGSARPFSSSHQEMRDKPRARDKPCEDLERLYKTAGGGRFRGTLLKSHCISRPKAMGSACRNAPTGELIPSSPTNMARVRQPRRTAEA